MSAPDLSTFAKVRAVHDSTTIPGEKAAAAGRMKALAQSAGMTVKQAKSKLDRAAKPAPVPPAPRNFFDDLFNSPEFRAQRDERLQRYAERRTAALAEYGSEDAVWAKNEREEALERACLPFIVRKPIINGEMDTLRGWDGGYFSRLDPDVQAAVAEAYAAPASVRAAWDEFLFWQKIGDDRTAFCDLYDHGVRVRARVCFIEHALDTLQARSIADVRTRLTWMEHINDQGWQRGSSEDATVLATLRADIERMALKLREADHAHS